MALDLSDITIMIVEDQRSIRGLLVSTIRTLGVGKVIGVHNADDALDRIRQIGEEAKYLGTGGLNAILLDIVLDESEKTGLDLAEWLRTSPDSPNTFIPIMMFSALASISMVQRSRDIGVNIFMRKPFAVDNLTTLLMGLIRDQRNFIKSSDYFGPDRRRPGRSGIVHDPERRNDGVSNASKGLKVFKRGKGAGSYALKEENIAKAGEIFDNTTKEAVADLDKRVEKVHTMHQVLMETLQTLQKISDTDPENKAKQTEKMLNMAHALLDNMVLVRLNLGVFSVPIFSQISQRLSEFVCNLTVDPSAFINKDSVTIIQKFIHIMQVVMQNIETLDDKQCLVVVEELQMACQRFGRKYNLNPMEDRMVDQKMRDSMARIKEQKLFDDIG